MLTGKTILVTGGTGSLGKALVRRLLQGDVGKPARVIIFSRDEAKQHALRMAFQRSRAATDEIIYDDCRRVLDFHIGDVRDYPAVCAAVRDADVIINAAALKQVPTCEYHPFEAIQTNTLGAENIVRAIREQNPRVEVVIGISTDKACKPVCVMGMTKALQERIFLRAGLDCPATRIMCVRYGNALASRGSVIPLFQEQIRQGGPVTVTTPDMTRFLLGLNAAVDVIFAALRTGRRGELYVPRVPAARIVDVAEVLIGDRPIAIEMTGVRPGEKTHEILVSEEEAHRTILRDEFFVIQPVLPELRSSATEDLGLMREYSSADNVMTRTELCELLSQNKLLEETPRSGRSKRSSKPKTVKVARRG